MYEQFWGLDRKPFDSQYAPDMFFASAPHQAAESKLRYVLESGLPAALITGGPGVGKTVLLRHLEQRYRGEIVFHQLPFPQLNSEQLLACIAARFAKEPAKAKQPAADSLRCIEERLVQSAADRQPICLVVDECHVLPSESLETLRLLLNLAEPSGAHLTLLLAGQPQVRKLLQFQPQLEERLAAHLNLARFEPRETAHYVRHRMAVAGAQRPIFSEPALETLHQLTQGVAGRINRLADMSLLVGFADDLSMIQPEQIAKVNEGMFSTPWAA